MQQNHQGRTFLHFFQMINFGNIVYIAKILLKKQKAKKKI